MVKAQYLTLCANDKQIGILPTPYNSKGMQVFAKKVIKVVSLVKKSRYEIAQQHVSPQPDITPSSAYGIQIGDDESRLESMGPESISLSLKDGSKAYGYGRSVWFVVANGKVARIATHLDILNNHGLNLIEFNENYDNDNWVIEGKVHKNDSYKKVESKLNLKKHGKNYVISNDVGRLITRFESFNTINSNNEPDILIGFDIATKNSKVSNSQIQFHALPDITLEDLLSADFDLESKIATHQNSNKLLIGHDGEWLIASPNLLLGLDHGMIKRLKITDSVVKGQSEKEFISFVKSFDIPITKNKFLSRFSDAEDNLDNLILERDRFYLSVNFDSYDDDAQLIDLELTLER